MAKICTPKFYEGVVNNGEQRLLDFLENNLPDSYFLIPNGEYPNRNPQGGVEYWEYDCIVVAPHAIYHIENKDWKGNIEGDDHVWYVNGHERKNPLKTARFKSKILVDYLKHKDPMLGKAWIDTLVALSYAGQSKSGLDADAGCYDKTFVVDDPALILYIMSPEKVGKQRGAIADLQYAIVEYLVGSSESKEKKKTHILDLEIDRILDTTDDYIEYLCHPKHFKDKYYRVRDYALDKAGMTSAELERHNNRVHNAQISLECLPSSPNIVKMECRESEDGNHYYEKSEYMEDHTLSAEMRRQTFTEYDKVKILLDVAKGLSEAHSNGVIHRNLSLENVYLIDSGKTAAIANFDMSYNELHEEINMTVQTEDFAISRFTALEITEGDEAPASDVYSFGVIVYELMTGVQLPVKDCFELITKGGVLPEEMLPSKVNPNVPLWVDDLCRRTIVAEMTERLGDIDEIKSFILKVVFGSAAPAETSGALKDLKAGDRLTHDLTLYEFIGEGGFSRVFKATHALQPGKVYAVKVFSEDLSPKAVIDEFNAMKELQHNNIVRFWSNGTSDTGLFYTQMEYIEGENLRKYAASDLRLPLPKIYSLAKQMLDALVYMQSLEKPVYHRDIKPENIVLDKNGRFVLIDFNIAADTDNVGEHKLGTYPYLAPDIQHNNKVIWDGSADTFALGITLYEMLTHTYPWSGSKRLPILDKAPTDIRSLNSQISVEFANFVTKAINTRKENRFRTAKEMYDALLEIGEDNLSVKTVSEVRPDHEYEIVDYLNSLYSQSSGGNSGTRAGLVDNALDRETYVQTKLDTKLLDAIGQGKFKLLIITGNAGDGKTAFIRRIEQRAENVEYFSDSRNGAKFKLGGIWYQSNYDGSQDESNLKNEEVLKGFFKPFEYIHDFRAASEGRIIAINEGRLVDFLNNNLEQHAHLAKSIDDFFYKEGFVELPDGLMVINLNHRSVTARDENGESLLRKQVKLLTAKKLWTKCENCPIANRCFIKYNVDSLSDEAAGSEVVNRLEWLLRTIIYKREMHVTMRDLRSMISWLVTRDVSCAHIPSILQQLDESKEAWLSDKDNEEKKYVYYYNRQFYWELYYFNITASPLYFRLSNNARPDHMSEDRLIKLLRQTDIAQVAVPDKDLELYYSKKLASDYIEFANRERSLLDEFNEANEVLPSYEQDQNELELLKRRHQTMVRHQYFEGKADFFRRLPYQSLEDFHKELNASDKQAIINELAFAISCSEGCWDKELSKDHLLLSASRVNDPYAKSYRRFPLSDFELIVQANDRLVEYLEHENDCLIFQHKEKKHIRLNVSLDLREMLYFIKRGFNPSVNDLKGRFVELQVFKNLLEAETYTELLVTNDNKRYYRIALDKATMKIGITRLNFSKGLDRPVVIKATVEEDSPVYGDFEQRAIEDQKSDFPLGDTMIGECRVTILKIEEPYRIEKNGKMVTISKRFYGYVTFPNGEIWDFTKAKQRGGAIARKCGLFVKAEHQKMK